MSNYGYGYEVNSGWHGYNQVYTLDDTRDNLLAGVLDAWPCCAQKRQPSPYPAHWPPVNLPLSETPLPLLATKRRFSMATSPLLWVGIVVLFMAVVMKLLV